MAIPSSLARAGQWLLNSGIQDSVGGVARFYRSDESRNRAVSTEITGYQISALTFLFQATADEAYLSRAHQTAFFLARYAWDPVLRMFPYEYPMIQPEAEPLAYFFDCGIIVRGLLSYWRISGEQEFLDAALACGDAMTLDFDSGTDFHPVLQLPQKKPAQREPRWSRSASCYQLKAGLALLELFEIRGELKFQAAYQRLLKLALESQGEFLAPQADPFKLVDRLHAYCYFLEAMLAALPNDSLARGIEAVAHHHNTWKDQFARCDVQAQLLRLRLYADRAGVVPLQAAVARQERDAILSFQASSEDPRIDGGYYFGSRDGVMIPHVSPVSTSFALQAVEMYRLFEAGLPLPDRRALI